MRHLARRFWAKVKRGAGCWTWTAAKTPAGYGMFQIGVALTRRAHRVAWSLARGPVPRGLLVCHRCDNRLCVRPGHLFLGTSQDNVNDAVVKGRHARGGEFTQSRLNENQATVIRKLRRWTTLTFKEIGALFGVSWGTAYDVCSGRTWKHIDEPPLRAP